MNSTSLSPFTLLSELPRSYVMTVNLLMMGRTFMTLSVVGMLDSRRGITTCIPCCPGGTFSLPGEWRSYVTSSQGTEYRKATTFSIAKCLSHSCCVKIPECRASASTKCESETVTTNLLRHTNAYDYNICVNSSEKNLVHPMFSSICGMYEHPSGRLFVCTTHQPCKVTRGRR